MKKEEIKNKTYKKPSLEEQYEKRKKIIMDLMEDPFYVPMKEKELAIMLQVEQEDRDQLKKILQDLLAENLIQISKRGKYSKAEKSEKFLTGLFQSHSSGFGFVTVEGAEQDYFIPEEYVNHAFHLDTVQILPLDKSSGKRPEAEVVSVISRGLTQVVGTYQKSKSFGFVIPDNTKILSDIFIPQERSKGAMTGHKVVAEITDYGSDRKKPEGKVLEILGHANDPGVDIMSLVKAFDLPVEFGEKVMNQTEKVSDQVSDADMIGRKDLRELRMVTIDGEDAKDLDDAVSLSKEGDKYKLGVHIADVTNYVQENSALDREALKRGTSVYLVDRVIPMLPQRISNGICSLNAGVDRLALSCLMTIDGNGNVIDYEVAETVINVDRRMTYTAVAGILEKNDQELIQEYEELVPMFHLMEELAQILRSKRHNRGSIDFDFPESKIILDKEGRPIDIKPYERNVATKIIEDFMLIANETIATAFYWLEIPFLYRAHENPDPERIEKLNTFVRNFGYSIKITKDEIHPKELQKLLEKTEGMPEEALISRLTLRSMKKASYSMESKGHFGLACEYYCHFTSPIRRYPDLQIHRIIKEYLRGRMNDDRMKHYSDLLPQVAEQTSKLERRADEVERETDKLKKAQYMEERIGSEYEGVISGITAWGFYVELPNTVEGLVHVSSLHGDYYSYDETAYEMVGQTTGRRFKLGDRIRIQVNGCDRITRTIDFVLPMEE